MGRRIVVADNDPEIIDLLVDDLRAEGHDVVATATQGDVALQLCLEHHPDVLVIDFRMPPGPNGIETATQVREQTPDVAVVLYTNYRAPDIRTNAERIGATYLLKGNLRALRRAVNGASESGQGLSRGAGR
jgi:CheY-like chemotaxis protein